MNFPVRLTIGSESLIATVSCIRELTTEAL